MARKIVLEVTFRAVSESDEYIPSDTMAEETVMLTIPNLESKYVVFPKVLEGVTIGVIRSHLAKVSAYLNKKDAEERRRREFEQMQLTYQVPHSTRVRTMRAMMSVRMTRLNTMMRAVVMKRSQTRMPPS